MLPVLVFHGVSEDETYYLHFLWNMKFYPTCIGYEEDLPSFLKVFYVLMGTCVGGGKKKLKKKK